MLNRWEEGAGNLKPGKNLGLESFSNIFFPLESKRNDGYDQRTEILDICHNVMISLKLELSHVNEPLQIVVLCCIDKSRVSIGGHRGGGTVGPQALIAKSQIYKKLPFSQSFKHN